MLMDRAYIERNQIINRYHQRKLNGSELNNFEEYILENPSIIREIEESFELHKAFKENKDLAITSLGAEKISYTRRFALAACLVLALTFVISSQTQEKYSLQAPILLQTFRGGNSDTMTISGQPIVQFQIDMGPIELIEHNLFTVNLVEMSNENIIFSQSDLVVDADGWLFYSILEQSSPISGIFEVQVSANDSPTDITSYEINFNN